MPAFLIALLPVLFTALRMFMIANAVGLVLRIIVALGINFLVMEPITDNILALITGQMDGFPAELAGWVGYLNLDRYLTLIFSAYGLVWTTNFVLRLNK